MKILFVSNLFPDASLPNRGSDNAVVLRYLARSAEIRVLCPRPLTPLKLLRSRFRACQEDEKFRPVFQGVPYVPKIGSRVNHWLMARGMEESLRRIRREFAFDVALVSWIYPDVCATALLAREMGFPVVGIAQGSDVHQYLAIPARRAVIQKYLGMSSGVITRSADLARRLEEAGIEKGKLRVVYNGIDFSLFHPGDSQAARRRLQLPAEGLILLFVGNLLPIKNPLLLLRAYAEVCRRAQQPVHLAMVGSGPLEREIRAEARSLGVGDRVIFAGRRPPSDVALFMQASDLLCLSSHNEGLPNVVLEAFACGLRVVSTRVGGIHEVLCHDYLGGFVEKSAVAELAATLIGKLGEKTERERVSRFAAAFSWEAAAAAYREMLEIAVKG